MAVVRAGFLRPKLGHRLHSTNFDSHLSRTVGRFGAGLTAKLSQAVYLYCEYDYATGDHVQAPWAADAGLRWQ